MVETLEKPSTTIASAEYEARRDSYLRLGQDKLDISYTLEAPVVGSILGAGFGILTSGAIAIINSEIAGELAISLTALGAASGVLIAGISEWRIRHRPPQELYAKNFAQISKKAYIDGTVTDPGRDGISGLMTKVEDASERFCNSKKYLDLRGSNRFWEFLLP